jgi:hypothetical protein
VQAYKQTAKNHAKRFNRVTKVVELFQKDNGSVKELVPCLWSKAQEILKDPPAPTQAKK